MSSVVTPTVIVLLSPEDTKTSAYRNSFHEKVKENSTAQMMPGNAMGSTTRMSACNRLQPSIIAHSSISRGMVRKYPMSSHVLKGTRKVGYVRMSAHGVSATPSRVTTMASG